MSEINLREVNFNFLKEISEQEDLSCSEFLDYLLEKMQEQPRPVGGWLAA